jgi:hypothetical protein
MVKLITNYKQTYPIKINSKTITIISIASTSKPTKVQSYKPTSIAIHTTPINKKSSIIQAAD